jgi:transposase
MMSAGDAERQASPGGRPSKLTPAQWDEIRRRLANGETVRGLAREFEVSPSAVSRNCSKEVASIKSAAWRLAQAEIQLQDLPLWERRAVRAMVDAMKATRKT